MLPELAGEHGDDAGAEDGVQLRPDSHDARARRARPARSATRSDGRGRPVGEERLNCSMKIMTVLGTRPEIIRLSRVIPLLDDSCGSHAGAHRPELRRPAGRAVLRELGVRAPDVYLGCAATDSGEQVARSWPAYEPMFRRTDRTGCSSSATPTAGWWRSSRAAWASRCTTWKRGTVATTTACPKRSTGGSSITAARCCCHTRIGARRICCAKASHHRIFVTGNPIKQVIDHYAKRSPPAMHCAPSASSRQVLPGHDAPGRERRSGGPLRGLVEAFRKLHEIHGFPVVCSFHPRTRSEIERFGIDITGRGFVRAAARLLRFRPTRADGVLRAFGQRDGPGRSLPVRQSERHDPRSDRAAGDAGVRIELSCRFRSRGNCTRRGSRAPIATRMEAAGGIPRAPGG